MKDDELMLSHTKIMKPCTYNRHNYPQTHIAFKQNKLKRNKKSQCQSPQQSQTPQQSRSQSQEISQIKISDKQPIICQIKQKRKTSVASVRTKIDTIKDKLNQEDQLKSHKKKKRKRSQQSSDDNNARRSKRLRV